MPIRLAVVGRWVVIRAIRVIRLIRDSDTDGRRGMRKTLRSGNDEAVVG